MTARCRGVAQRFANPVSRLVNERTALSAVKGTMSVFAISAICALHLANRHLDPSTTRCEPLCVHPKRRAVCRPPGHRGAYGSVARRRS